VAILRAGTGRGAAVRRFATGDIRCRPRGAHHLAASAQHPAVAGRDRTAIW
jgi:hypothetical protein